MTPVPAPHSRWQQAKLLISVRNAQEATGALAAGCDVLDIKEPERGSLGMAALPVIRQVCKTAAESETQGGAISVSAALGETTDWLNDTPVPSLQARISYCKLGTAGLGHDGDWPKTWHDVRRRFDAEAEAPRNWIAVAYADWQRANAPPPQQVLDAAVATGCRGLLVDTFIKDGRTLLDWLTLPRLSRFLQRVRTAGLLSAVAGGLTRDNIPTLIELQPDVVAVRSAACRNQHRNGPVCPRAIADLRQRLAETFASA